MIFVTVGTQPNGFERCLKQVELLVDEFNIKDEIIAQIGHTKFSTNKFKTIKFVNEDEYDNYVRKADIVITHAGSGAIFKSIASGKKIIAMARLHDYNEMIDNHQLELVQKLSNDGYLIDGSYSLLDAWKKIEKYKPRGNDFKCSLIEILDKYIRSCIE